jgi:hypothetical protein
MNKRQTRASIYQAEKREEKRTSPTPEEVKSQEVMDFPDAMRQIIAGRKVTKLEWDNPKVFCFLNDAWVSIHKEDGKNYKWMINDGDATGKDWVIV